MDWQARVYCPNCQRNRTIAIGQNYDGSLGTPKATHCPVCRCFLELPKPSWTVKFKHWVSKFQKKPTVAGNPKPEYRRSAVLFGGWSDDPSSELYIRPDKDHPDERARRTIRDYTKIEQLEKEGKTPRLKDVTGMDDFKRAKARVRFYRNQARTA